MAFGIFHKRRRGEQPETPVDEVSIVAAAVAVETPPPETGLEADEAMLPRWRRPSLLQARRGDKFHDDMPAPPLTFELGQIGPSDGHERRLIRYRLVRMLDTPDELRGTEIGYLDRGDEVQLVEKYGAYWLVLCPDGRQGWLHKMTLGDVVDDQATETWESPDSGDQMLAAYLEARARA